MKPLEFRARSLSDAFRGLEAINPRRLPWIEIDASEQPGVTVQATTELSVVEFKHALKGSIPDHGYPAESVVEAEV